MKKVSIYFISVPLALFVILGLLFFLSINEEEATPLFSDDELEVRDELLKSYLDEQSALQNKIVTLRKNIEETENEIAEHKKVANIDVLDSLKKQIGLTDISGEGIEVVLDDSSFNLRSSTGSYDSGLVQASDIRDVVNILRSSKPDAVAVNNQRVIATSPINSVGSSILVNNSFITPPFVISASGDSDVMIQRLLDKDLLPELYRRSKENGIIFQIYKKKNVFVPLYNGEIKTDYLNIVQ